MSKARVRARAVVGDIGGTNARFGALLTDDPHALSDIRVYPCLDFEGLADAFQMYLADSGLSTDCLSVAMACPVERDIVKMTNNHWQFSKRELLAQLGLAELRVINDFTAQSLAVPLLTDDEQLVLHAGEPGLPKPKLVIGPGTGLGVGGLVPTANAWVPIVCEGGHVAATATTAEESQVIDYLRERFGHVSAERLISGQGIENLHEAFSHLAGTSEPEDWTAAIIARRAQEGRDELSVKSLNTFCAMLGTTVGNAAVTLGSLGGIYLCGGILPRMVEFLLASEFLHRLHHKGRFERYMQSMPVILVTAPYAGLLGAAAAVDNTHLDYIGSVERRHD
ncbi:glucokinase [Litorivicinus lipolyticus]|uniref:glucokinase n=1 Tax=Litorivicinus lipolyticus TaxID=418701 RepID=UPI003B59688A